MLEFGRVKIEKAGLGATIQLETGDSEQLRFEDARFDAVTVAFGVRNFENLEKGFAPKCSAFCAREANLLCWNSPARKFFRLNSSIMPILNTFYL